MTNIIDKFADIRILKFDVPEFSTLDLKTKKLIYYLSEAALCGRDILFDQHFKYNIVVRSVLEQIVIQTNGANVNQDEFNKLLDYLKRVWFSSGIHHHNSTLKFMPSFKPESFKIWFYHCNWSQWFTEEEMNKVYKKMVDIIYNPSNYKRRVSQDTQRDLLINSANNLYAGVSQKEAEEFYHQLKKNHGKDAPSFGLNSRLVKANNLFTEQVYKVDGKYSESIKQIVFWLSKASEVANNDQQKKVIDLLISFYEGGDLAIFDQYNIEWLNENQSPVDFINGFIEVYGDPIAIKGSWEALVNIIDEKETSHVKVISDNAQWFEDNSPIAAKFKKKKVTGVNMKIINAVVLGGDCYPASPLGINLPNADWLREKHGSKSVSLANISQAHHLASLTSGVVEEFAASPLEIDLHKRFGTLADHLHTHLHECLGHGSGKMAKGITTDTLKAYASVIEETRADLFGLYFMMDQKMVDLELTPSLEVAKCQYNSYIRNGLMVQLTRILPNQNIEQAHMRNRQLIASWVYKHSQGAITKTSANGKTYFSINNYDVLRTLFGQLLKEVQRIKSEGDYEAAQTLVETYGVKVDETLHTEVLERFHKLNLPPFAGFINPNLIAVKNSSNQIVDIKLDTDESYQDQMMRYSSHYGFLVDECIEQFKLRL